VRAQTAPPTFPVATNHFSAENAAAPYAVDKVDKVAVRPTAPTELWIPSQRPSGNAVNDRIWLTYYPALRPAASGIAASRAGSTSDSTSRVPAAVLLHYLGTAHNAEMHRFARHLSRRGIAAAVMTLPYHLLRARPHEQAVHYFVAPDASVVAQAFDQSASDVSTVVSWLIRQDGIDPQRIGAVGISLGAIVTHLSMARDARIGAGVAMLGGGDLLDIYRRSIIGKILVKKRIQAATPAEEALIRTVDPLFQAHLNQPRRVLMIEAARDSFIPPGDAEKLWKALGQPPIQWLDINHLGLQLAPRAAMRTTTSFLEQAWSSKPLESIRVPRISVPTLKAGFLIGLDALVTPAIQIQALTLGKRRDHMALLHADVGLSGRGPFAGVAVTLNQFADVGIGRRLGGSRFRPYASLHFTF
jgi:dienelactone hydrolase